MALKVEQHVLSRKSVYCDIQLVAMVVENFVLGALSLYLRIPNVDKRLAESASICGLEVISQGKTHPGQVLPVLVQGDPFDCPQLFLYFCVDDQYVMVLIDVLLIDLLVKAKAGVWTKSVTFPCGFFSLCTYLNKLLYSIAIVDKCAPL